MDALAGEVATQDGRRLTYLEVREPGGPLVIHNHGGPSSRFEAPLLANSASKNRLRLICVDRPGMGRSSPQKARIYSGWADDLVAVADALGHHEFGVTGWSEGGPWAIAAAAYIDLLRLRHVSSIAGGSYGTFGDDWAAEYLSKIDALGGTLALRFKPAFRLMYASLGITAKHFRGSFVKQTRSAVNDYDRQILLRPEIATTFDVTTIKRRVHMWQGLDDRLVPAPINKTVADRMPGAVWHPVGGAGHFVAVGSGDDVFGIAAEELGTP